MTLHTGCHTDQTKLGPAVHRLVVILVLTCTISGTPTLTDKWRLSHVK